MKKSLIFWMITAAAGLLLAACSPTPAAPAVAAAQVETLIAEGRLQPVNALEQSFTIPGQLAEVLVKDGETVKAGQVLARLNSSPEGQLALARAQQEVLAAEQALEGVKAAANAALAQSRLAVIAAEKELEKAKTRYAAELTDENDFLVDEAKAKLKLAQDALAKRKAGGGTDPDQLAAAEARLVTAKAGLNSAQAALAAQELKATLAGTVVNVNIQTGQKVAAGQTILTVADFSRWVVKTNNLSEIDVVKVQVGQKVSIVLDALPGQTLTGEVSHIQQFFEEKRGDVTYTVTAVLSQPVSQMRWGMTSAVQFLP